MITQIPDSLAAWADRLGPAPAYGALAVAPSADPAVQLAAALALWAPLHGHSCVDLASATDDLAADLAAGGGSEVAAALPPLPPVRPWIDALVASPLVRVVSGPDADPAVALDDRPLVLHGTRLFTQRQWIDECTVASALASMAADVVGPPQGDIPLLEGEQLAAASHDRRLTVIVGGPGTGKTYTVGALLAGHLGPHRGTVTAFDRAGPRIGLAAPTGKAAARLTESIGAVADAIRAVGDPDGVAERLAGLRAVTLHRLLGPLPDHRSRFRHTAADPLPYDVVVIDETSMLPMPLMARLLEAVPPHCRLVLLGDPDQLESIEVGAVLADVVAAAEAGGPMTAVVRRLVRQRRTAADSPIAALADAVREHDPDRALRLLRDGHDLLSFVELGGSGDAAALAAVADGVVAEVTPAFGAAAEAARRGDAGAALGALAGIRVLCGHRQGPFGVEGWNRRVEQAVHGRVGREYPGRPLLATSNDLRTGVVNGDTGILVMAPSGDRVSPTASDRGLRAAFGRADGVHTFALAELDAMDTAYAMTVHKTQGSEYDTVVLIHPPAESPLAGRELLYTAVTRAKRRLVVVASEAAVRTAIITPARRITGLRDALRR